MKVYCLALLVFSPLLVSSLKLVSKPKETYASYATKNGIAINKADSDATAQYVTCYDYFGQGGSSYRVTGKSFSAKLILASTNPHYDKILFIDLPVQYMKTTSSEHIVYKKCFSFLFMNTTCSEFVVFMY